MPLRKISAFFLSLYLLQLPQRGLAFFQLEGNIGGFFPKQWEQKPTKGGFYKNYAAKVQLPILPLSFGLYMGEAFFKIKGQDHKIGLGGSLVELHIPYISWCTPSIRGGIGISGLHLADKSHLRGVETRWGAGAEKKCLPFFSLFCGLDFHWLSFHLKTKGKAKLPKPLEDKQKLHATSLYGGLRFSI